MTITPSPPEKTTSATYKGPVCRGDWSLGNNCKICERCIATRPAMTITHDAAKQFTTLRDLIADTAADLSAANPYWTAGCLADALIRTGQLVLVDDGAVERVALILAPHLEGGREWDQMPPDKITLRQWSRQGMCSINDATRADAIDAARAALAALQVKP